MENQQERRLPMINIHKSFSTKLSIGIMLLAVPIFCISLAALFLHSRYIIRKEAVGRANSVLSTTIQHVYRYVNTIETATNVNSWLIVEHLDPDSLLDLSYRIVRQNPHIDGCSISTEPDIFPKYGRYFSVYSIRNGKTANGRDSIKSAVEEQYEYFTKIWYKSPHDLGKACWTDFYDDIDTLKVVLSGLIASYSKPIYDNTGRMVAVISTDMSLSRLSKDISKDKPYPHSYFMMVNKEGSFIIHPDSTKLFNQTIFSGLNPNNHSDIFALGHEMTTGVKGCMNVTFDGEPCIVCYQPIPGTSWSLAIVCPNSDILEEYYKLTYIIIPLLIVGFFLILLLCHRTVNHAILPLNQLLEKTQSIAAGNMEIHIPNTKREDVVGRLQNSFAMMLQSLNFHMGSVRYSTEQTKLHNEKLREATELAKEADRQKRTFIQNVTHQIRTPLNIIMGFVQILSDKTQIKLLPKEELKNITDTMEYNSRLLTRMVLMLFDSSDLGYSEELLTSNQITYIVCNDMAREVINYGKKHFPNLSINLQSEVADDFSIRTNGLYLMRSLRELVYNSAKYSDGKHVTFRITTTDSTLRFIIEDKGKGIPKANREHIFNFFIKIDDLSEGLGLGLPLAKRHAQSLGGDLIFDEDYHDGCRFIFELPLT